MAEIQLENVAKIYDSTVAVAGINLTLPDGAFVVLLGPSGCGKTTTLQMIAGLDSVTDGRILFDGVDVTGVPPHKRDIAMVFQSYALYPQMTARENMTFGLRVRRTPKREAKARVEEVAEMLTITELLERKPATLSGGQRQRVAVGRALVRRPRAFLLDEPLSNVDAKLRSEMRSELRGLQRQLEATFVYVTHDQLEAMTMADFIAVMDRGELLQVGTPDDVYARPATQFVAEFIGSPPMNLMKGAIEKRAGGGCVAVVGPWRIPFEGDFPEESCTVGIHYEDLALVDAPGQLTGQVTNVEHLGAEKRVMITSECGTIGVRVDRSERVELGAEVGVEADVERMHVFVGKARARAAVAARGLLQGAAGFVNRECG